MLLAFLMLWAYQSYLAVPADLGRATSRRRSPGTCAAQTGGWGWTAVSIIALGFLLPFLLLIFREIKRSARALGCRRRAAAGDAPGGGCSGWSGPGWVWDCRSSLIAVAATVGLGGIWLWWFGRELDGPPAASPLHDPRLANLPAELPEGAGHASA